MRHREPEVHVFLLGAAGAPDIGTSDPDLLCWLEEHDCLLITGNRSTMPTHLRNHLASGRHGPGILIMSRRLSLGETIDELHLIWGASLPDEYRDRIVYLPISR